VAQSPICPPGLSIVIPTFNRQQAVTNLVNELFREQHTEIATEIIIVVDGSTDGTAQALAALQPPAGTSLDIVPIINSGRAAARNAGIARCSGEFVLFLDDDVLPLGSLVSAHLTADRDADVVLGRIEAGDDPLEHRVFRSLSQQFYIDRHKRLTQPHLDYRATDVFAGNISISRALLEQVGGFDPTYNGYGCEDWDLGQRLIMAGARFAYAPDAAVVHNSTTTPARWLRNAREEAITQQLLVEKYPALVRDVTLGGLFEDPLIGRSVSHLAVQFPRLARVMGTIGMSVGALVDPLPVLPLNRRIAAQCWQLHFWSSVSLNRKSAIATRTQFEFHGRILCYHRITDNPNPVLLDYAVRPADFRSQMQWLRDNGWTVLSLSEMLDAFDAGKPLHKAVAITFDDGYQDLLDHALPILREFGYAATVYVVTDFFGGTAEWDCEFGGEMAPVASIEDIRRLECAGWEIGHHTRTHPVLTTLDDDQLDEEIVGGKRKLEALLGHPVSTFAYPFGVHDIRVRRAAKRAGFRAAFALGTRVASGRSPEFAIERVCVLGNHTFRDLRSLLWFGWDFSGAVQYFARIPISVVRGPQESLQEPPL
jgi:peptidoglycan/xylan/chitin deacetylase (PgdA/CDA1 family)/GT2 family glycosyltransferase